MAAPSMELDALMSQRILSESKGSLPAAEELEQVPSYDNIVYDNADQEPELHVRTWVALGAIFLFNFVGVVALQGPPTVLSYISASLHGTKQIAWVSNSLTVTQAVLAPGLSSASDIFQARKSILIGAGLISLIGSAIAPGSSDVYRLIGAQILIGVGFAATPLGYAVPSEIMPRRWRPMSQGICVGVAAALASVVAPLAIGAFTKADPVNGWRKFYWIQTGLWGAAVVAISLGYRPPRRHTRFDHFSFWQKLGRLDVPGLFLLATGLCLLLTGLSLGGGQYPWKNSRVLATLILGGIFLILFGLFQWKGTTNGFLNHELFRGGPEGGRTFVLCVGFICIEGALLFACMLFYPILTGALFTTDTLLLVVRELPFFVCNVIASPIWGFWSVKTRTLKAPLLVGFVILTGGIVGLATIQPGQSPNMVVFAGLVGFGIASPLVLALSGVQLATPGHLIATATAVVICARATTASIFSAIYLTVFNNRLSASLPSNLADAAAKAGLPAASIPTFVTALSAGNLSTLSQIRGVTPTAIDAGIAAIKQSYADSVRVVFIIAAPFGALACLACHFLVPMHETMNYRVDAPVEELHEKSHGLQRPDNSGV
ncbi:uncharacterized protein Z520_02851 [Fonsecaea multimorphosa CBS 102226]|uniref:Major facilitator superfamily (MFS) profile domain-containing protein n=1 Tax=Fonsecaea multimorphosa CBS 102226 TaxID=1442371 RepID=A0A0D2KWV1_9EURO|nr:uncharacterized protein Z520_02851 [Fonsecaea multimorphosa CBS 102226]KIY01299.1 hypothetical protein Z520_02851 [Fonsecaea multimorphosa CBS 102226]